MRAVANNARGVAGGTYVRTDGIRRRTGGASVRAVIGVQSWPTPFICVETVARGEALARADAVVL